MGTLISLINLEVTVHIFRQPVLEEIHRVALGCSHENNRNSCVKNEREGKTRESSSPRFFLTSEQPTSGGQCQIAVFGTIAVYGQDTASSRSVSDRCGDEGDAASAMFKN